MKSSVLLLGLFLAGCYTSGGGGGSTGCYYNDPVTGAPDYRDCGWIALCDYGTSVCACTSDRCFAGEVQQITFDFHVTGGDATGSVDVPGGLHNVYLTR